MMDFYMLSSIIGFYMLIMGVSMVLNSSDARMAFKAMVDSKGLSGLLAVFRIAVGLYILHMHNMWDMNWEILITLFGWAALAFGSLRFLTPDWYSSRFANKFSDPSLFMYLSWVYLLAGAFILKNVYY